MGIKGVVSSLVGVGGATRDGPGCTLRKKNDTSYFYFVLLFFVSISKSMT